MTAGAAARPLRTPHRRRGERGLPGIELTEQGWHLLRTAPAGAWAAWATGAVPGLIALLYFTGDMSRGATGPARLPFAALGLALAFLWASVWQAEFGVRLRAHLGGRAAPALSPARLARMARNQAIFQPWALWIQPLALLASVPLPWTTAYFTAVSALDDGSLAPGEIHSRAWRAAGAWPNQNLVATAVLGVFGLFVLVNTGLALLTVPDLLSALLGIETPFSRLGGFDGLKLIFNSTFLSVWLALSACALDPLVRACMTLRLFLSESLATGEDLRVALAEVRAREAAR